jgi:hypothetical protein
MARIGGRDFFMAPTPVHNLIQGVFVITWVGGDLALYFRAYKLQRRYYAYFPHEIQFSDRNPFIPDSPRSRRALWILMLDEQPDTFLEAMRRKIWLRLATFAAWLFGWPMVFLMVNIAFLLHGIVL